MHTPTCVGLHPLGSRYLQNTETSEHSHVQPVRLFVETIFVLLAVQRTSHSTSEGFVKAGSKGQYDSWTWKQCLLLICQRLEKDKTF